MRFLLNILFSTRFTAILLGIFGYAIAVATFIENEYGTTTARIEVFRSKWLEVVLVLLAINFLGNIKKYNMISQKKWPSLVFHLAFVVIIIGAGVTRYFGFEGMLPVREGQTESIMFSAEPYLDIEVTKPRKSKDEKPVSYRYSEPMLMAATTDNEFEIPSFNIGDDEITISYVDYFENADYKLFEVEKGGNEILEVVTTNGNGRQTVYIESGNTELVGRVSVSFNTPSPMADVVVMEKNDSFFVVSPHKIPRMRMRDQMKDTVMPNQMAVMDFRQAHEVNGNILVFANKYDSAVKLVETIEGESRKGDALKIKIKIGEEETERVLFGGPEHIASLDYFRFMGYELKASYGSKQVKLPFNVRLNDFVVERYPGSESPSGYRSEITLYDQENAVSEDHSIYMNNVLDYSGYRLFQSGFDPDEKGTKLSVNNDVPGTIITYIGYLLLGLGFVLSLLNKQGRFSWLINRVKSLREKRITMTVIGLLFAFSSFAQDGHDHDHEGEHDHDHNDNHISDSHAPLSGSANNGAVRISIEHAQKFGKLVVQSHEGRFEPINTMALDIVHKLSRQEKIDIEGVGNFTPEQFVLEMIVNGKLFDGEDLIHVSSDSLKTYLGVPDKKFLAFSDFFKDDKNKLEAFVTTAFQKDPAKQDRWDKEVIKVNDKMETYRLTQVGGLLALFPSLDSTRNNKWISIMDPESIKPLSGEVINEKGDALQLKDYTYMKLWMMYVASLREGNFELADGMLNLITQVQRKYTPEGILPSSSKVDLEIMYNDSGIFNNVEKGYRYLSVFLLLLAFVDALTMKKKDGKLLSPVKWPLRVFVWLHIAVFLYHTYGLALRWYLTNHAPWSNGYEALVFIAWGTVFAGVLFSKYSKITLAGTAFVAFLIIMTASHENMNPQLTNLVPVLKSYWLVIHVACITISYGFFGLGAILGLIVMGTMVFKNKKNFKKLDTLTSELTFINEMTVTIGVVLAAVGTFLGGIWANESWGRYWGWDAKETWALIIVIVYAMLLHFRFIPGVIRSKFSFNAFGTIAGFGAVCMTFFGVNFYFSNSIHSYAAGDPPAFPIWLWITIGLIFVLTILAGIRNSRAKALFEAKD